MIIIPHSEGNLDTSTAPFLSYNTKSELIWSHSLWSHTKSTTLSCTKLGNFCPVPDPSQLDIWTNIQFPPQQTNPYYSTKVPFLPATNSQASDHLRIEYNLNLTKTNVALLRKVYISKVWIHDSSTSSSFGSKKKKTSPKNSAQNFPSQLAQLPSASNDA